MQAFCNFYIPYLPFNITLYLNTLLNTKNKHFPNQMGTFVCYCLLDNIHIAEELILANLDSLNHTNITYAGGFKPETLHLPYPGQKQHLSELSLSIPESKQKALLFSASGLLPLASGQHCYRHTGPCSSEQIL